MFSQQPQTVWLLPRWDGGGRPFAEVLPGDVIVVSAGGLMPVDGTVLEGLASVDQQMLTGEAQPVEKAPGEPGLRLDGGLAGKVHVRVEKAGDETVSAQIGHPEPHRQLSARAAGEGQPDCERRRGADAGSRRAGLMTRGTESGLALLNSAFGISLRISAPITMLNLLNIAAEHAILIKDGRSLELLSDVDTVLFDKTGTLTLARPTWRRFTSDRARRDGCSRSPPPPSTGRPTRSRWRSSPRPSAGPRAAGHRGRALRGRLRHQGHPGED